MKKINSILFIVPPRKLVGIELISEGFHPPYGFLYLAEEIKNKVDKIQIIDCPAQKIDEIRLLKMIKDNNPDLIGLTTLTYNSKTTIELIKKIKKNSTAILIGGGPHFSYEYEIALNEGLDYVCRFANTQSLSQLIDAINQNKALNEIPNLVYKKNKKLIVNAQIIQKQSFNQKIPNLEKIQLNRYWWWFKSPKNISLNTSVGCMKKCLFCTLPEYWGEFSRMPAQEIINTIILLKQQNISVFWFTDDDFLTDTQNFETFCDILIKKNIKINWFFQTRCDRVVKNKKLLEKAKIAGAFFILLGVETYSNKRLKQLNKQITKKEIVQANKILNNQGYLVWNSFIVGLPEDTKKEFEETYNFAKILNSEIVTFTPLSPLPGNKEWNSYKKDINYSELTLYDSPLNTKFLDKKSMQKKIKQIYLKYYLRPSLILKIIRRSTLIKKIMLKFYYKGSRIFIKRI